MLPTDGSTRPRATVIQADCLARLRTMESCSVNCCVTSPPYWGLRDYGTATWEGGDAACDHKIASDPRAGVEKSGLQGGKKTNGHQQEGFKSTCGKCGARRIDQQIGLESTPDEYVARLVAVFAEVRRVLRDDGTCWINLGDSYNSAGARTTGRNDNGQRVSAPETWNCRYEYEQTEIKTAANGLKPKDLVGIPWLVAFALRADGWYLRQDIIWSKPNQMPESVTDRCTKSHEYIFLLSKSARYWYDAAAIAEKSIYAGDIKKSLGTTKEFDPVRQRTKLRGERLVAETRNKRSVWTVSTQPFNGWAKTVHRERVEEGALSGDTKRTESPDCPLHGGRLDQACNGQRGEYAVDPSCGIGSTDGRHDLKLHGEHASTGRSREHCSGEQSSDLIPPSNSRPATDHSIRVNKKDRVPATTSSCTPSAQTEPGIDDKPESHESSGPCLGTSENSRGSVDSPCDPSPESRDCTAGTLTEPESLASVKSLRKLGCMCEFYREVTTKQAHFATFPPKLIEPCILAGCPVGGLVLDPFCGSGTTGEVSLKLDRNFIGLELNPEYVKLAEKRIGAVAQYQSLFSE